jgi:hypothetical protein
MTMAEQAVPRRSTRIIVRIDDDAQKVTLTLPSPSPAVLHEAQAVDQDLEGLAALVARESGIPTGTVLRFPMGVLPFIRRHYQLEH